MTQVAPRQPARTDGRTQAVEWAATWLLAAAAVLGPIALGCTGPWTRLALELTATAAVVLWAASGRRSLRSVIWPLALAALVLLQLVPLPDRLLMAIAPISGGAWRVARAGLPHEWGTVSIDPGATAAAGRRLLIGLATLACVSSLARDPARRRTLLGALGASAVVILALGLAFPVDWNERILLGFIDLKGPLEFYRSQLYHPAQTAGWAELIWTTAGSQRYLTELALVGDGFGSYISTNEFAAGVYLTVPIAAAWLVFLAAGRLSVPGRCAAAALLAGALWIVGRMAGSRAGAAALLLAALVTAAVMIRAPWPRRVLSGLAGAYAAGLLLFVGLFLTDARGFERLVPSRLRPLVAATRSDGRVVASRVATRMFRAAPLFGTGLDSYADLYPRLQPGMSMQYYAHNDYAQLLAETGLVGLAAAAGILWWLLLRFRAFRRAEMGPERILDAGAWAALAALLVHSAFDWNLHVPANAFLATIVAGLAAASGARPGARPAPAAVARWATAARFLLIVCCIVAAGFLARDAWSESVQRTLRHALLAAQVAPRPAPAAASGIDVAAAVAAGERTLAWDPANARLRLLLGRIALHVPDLRERANDWFRDAQARCACCRGLPEAVPPSTPSH